MRELSLISNDMVSNIVKPCNVIGVVQRLQMWLGVRVYALESTAFYATAKENVDTVMQKPMQADPNLQEMHTCNMGISSSGL
jgi:hypothetical protein